MLQRMEYYLCLRAKSIFRYGSIRKVTREVNGSIRTHIKPGLGAIQLDAPDAHLVQSFYNGLREPTKDCAAFTQDCEKCPQNPPQDLTAGAAWSNPLNLVFTNELGGNLIPQTVVRHFKELVTAIGRPDARFHDLRHSYAVASLRSGDDIKTV